MQIVIKKEKVNGGGWLCLVELVYGPAEGVWLLAICTRICTNGVFSKLVLNKYFLFEAHCYLNGSWGRADATTKEARWHLDNIRYCYFNCTTHTEHIQTEKE